MFEKEEKELLKWKEQFEKVDIPTDEIDQAIQIGLQKAKSTETVIKPKRKSWIWSSAVAAILLLGLLTCIRVSPSFASYLTNVPGMDKIVELIRDDKGLMSAVENKYAQEIGISQEINGIKITIDSVIADEQGMVIFYTVKTKETLHDVQVNNVELLPKNGEQLPNSTVSMGGTKEEEVKGYTDKFEFSFSDPINSRDFNLEIKLKSREVSEQFSIPFSIKKQEKTNQIYELNKTVTIEGQKFTIKKVTIYPLRVAVNIDMDPTNTKKILEFKDLRLVDQNGETWSKINHGMTGQKVSETEIIVYLQSNYFKNPKELYLVVNKLQAVDKDEEYILVDTVKQQILKQPKGNLLTDFKKDGETLTFTLNTKKEFNYSLFGQIFDANGKEIQSNERYSGGYNENKHIEGLKISSQNYTNPLKIKLEFYPSWIEGEAKVRVK